MPERIQLTIAVKGGDTYTRAYPILLDRMEMIENLYELAEYPAEFVLVMEQTS